MILFQDADDDNMVCRDDDHLPGCSRDSQKSLSSRSVQWFTRINISFQYSQFSPCQVARERSFSREPRFACGLQFLYALSTPGPGRMSVSPFDHALLDKPLFVVSITRASGAWTGAVLMLELAGTHRAHRTSDTDSDMPVINNTKPR